MQTFGTAVIDHILHHIVHKVLVAYGFEKPFDCKTMPSHILSWRNLFFAHPCITILNF